MVFLLGFLKLIGLLLVLSGNSGFSLFGSCLNVMLMGVRKMCRCLECKMRIRNVSMILMCSNSVVVLMILLVGCLRG